MLNLVFFILSILGVVLTSISKEVKAPKFDPVLLPPQQIEHFTFSYDEIMADLLWLRAIQSLDYCGKTFITDEQVKLGTNVFRICQEGWVYQMLDAATRITPRYRIIYSRGAVALSVLVNDRQGALQLFERGSKVYPQDWVIRYYSGFHRLMEMNDPAGAAEDMRMAGLNGAPNWLTLLAARLYNEAGQAEFGLRALSDFYGQEPFGKWPARAQERWRELETKLGRKVTPPTPTHN
ncbi:MAG: hypothetical protein AB7N80_11980 [Bdellovibrionales bacterium]